MRQVSGKSPTLWQQSPVPTVPPVCTHSDVLASWLLGPASVAVDTHPSVAE
jgi:hypothetical protein